MLPHLLHTARLTLRPITTADAATIFEAYAQDPEASRFMAWRPHQSLEESEAFVSQSLAREPALGRTYVIAGREDTDLGMGIPVQEVGRPGDDRKANCEALLACSASVRLRVPADDNWQPVGNRPATIAVKAGRDSSQPGGI